MLDSSVLVKLVLSEEFSEDARAAVTRILDEDESISTTELALPEVGNAIWKQVRLMRQLDEEGYRTAMGSAIRLASRLRLVPTIDVAEDASEVALEEGITFYDSLYIAAASYTGSRLLTADRRQHEAARGRVESTLIGRQAA